MNETVVTLVGNLTAKPELRFTPSGAAVANFTVAQTPRVYDKTANEWKDGEPLFMRCSIWRQAAENVAESLDKGNAVIVKGILKQRSYTDKEGNNRTVYEVEATEVGINLARVTASITPNERRGGGNGGGGTSSSRPANSAPSQTDEPPF